MSTLGTQGGQATYTCTQGLGSSRGDDGHLKSVVVRLGMILPLGGKRGNGSRSFVTLDQESFFS